MALVKCGSEKHHLFSLAVLFYCSNNNVVLKQWNIISVFMNVLNFGDSSSGRRLKYGHHSLT